MEWCKTAARSMSFECALAAWSLNVNPVMETAYATVVVVLAFFINGIPSLIILYASEMDEKCLMVAMLRDISKIAKIGISRIKRYIIRERRTDDNAFSAVTPPISRGSLNSFGIVVSA